MLRRSIVTADGVASPASSQGEIYSILINTDGSASVVSIYDGQDGSGTLLRVVRTATGQAETNLFIPYYNGLYVDVDAHTTSVVIVYDGAKP